MKYLELTSQFSGTEIEKNILARVWDFLQFQTDTHRVSERSL